MHSTVDSTPPRWLESLDPNDRQPQRDDPRFGGDYKLFRKADQAWNKRERNRRKKAKLSHEPAPPSPPRAEPAAADARAVEAAAEAAKPHHPRPRGPAPAVEGVPCTWDSEHGCWRTADGHEHVVESKDTRTTLGAARPSCGSPAGRGGRSCSRRRNRG